MCSKGFGNIWSLSIAIHKTVVIANFGLS